MAHICVLMEFRQPAEKRLLTPALDALTRRVPRHPPPMPLGRLAVPGQPDAAAAAARVLVRASYVLACSPLYRFRALLLQHALHAALPPGHAWLGRHRLQVGGAWRGGGEASFTRGRAWVGGA